jgi:ABC-2 type transport system permease protein
MLPALRAEFRKLFTVRSTYFITGGVTVLVMLIAFLLEGWRLQPDSLHNPYQLASDITGALNLTIFGAIIAILLVTHEYRYNTITYTLISSNSRSKVLVAKFVVVSVYAVFLTVLIGVLSPLLAYLGAHAHGLTFAHQTLHYSNLAWRSLFYGWGYGMAGLILALLARNQVASIVALFVIPGVIEQLLTELLLKHNGVYLPFNALSQVLNGPAEGAGSSSISSNLSSGKAAGVYCIYLVVGVAVSWYLFLKRDAN